ncbi:hypothetical protein [Paenibacillus jiagnxiensis]|uniref:hypothetical protein n=1 Tax=Paenibacillus jiagnxiensis TaxID=3228926 RepID=UPI0033A56C4E
MSNQSLAVICPADKWNEQSSFYQQPVRPFQPTLAKEIIVLSKILRVICVHDVPTGASGATGATGATGVTGPTGPTFATSSGTFSASNLTDVDVGANFPLNQVVNNGTAFTLSGGDTINISEPGSYLVNYWAQGDATGPPQLIAVALRVNGAIVSATSRMTQQVDTGWNYLQVNGSYILNVTTTPTTLNLVNRSNSILKYSLADTTNNQITARNIQTNGITIVKIS